MERGLSESSTPGLMPIHFKAALNPNSTLDICPNQFERESQKDVGKGSRAMTYPQELMGGAMQNLINRLTSFPILQKSRQTSQDQINQGAQLLGSTLTALLPHFHTYIHTRTPTNKTDE